MPPHSVGSYLITFVHIAAIVLVRSESVARSAFTAEGPQSVPTTSVSTQEWHHVTLVNVDTVVVGAQFKTRMAVALVGTNQIDASAIVANVCMADALVDIYAVVSGGRKHVACEKNT